MTVFVAYRGDWTKEIVGVFSTVEKAQKASETLKNIHIYEIKINDESSECHCLNCRPNSTSYTTGLTEGKPLWVCYHDWDAWNDRPAYTVGIQKVTDTKPDDSYRHVVQVGFDVPVAEPEECSDCEDCHYKADLARRYEESNKQNLRQELARVQEQLRLVDCV